MGLVGRTILYAQGGQKGRGEVLAEGFAYDSAIKSAIFFMLVHIQGHAPVVLATDDVTFTSLTLET